MFLGQHHLSVDSNRDLVIPNSFRDLYEGAFITRGFELNLLIMSDMSFHELYKRVIALNIADPHARLLHRLILGNASRLDISSSGHVLIPADLMSFAGMEKEIILVGQGDYIELWSPSQWEKQSSILNDAEANAERFAQLNLAA